MISPEEDYDTWSLIVTTVEDDLPSFANLYPDIKRLFSSISQTGMLPDPISQRTDEFISLQINITSTFLNLYNLDESSFYIIIEYFQTVIEFSVSQLKTRTQIALSILDLCFAENYNLNGYNPDYKIRETLIQFFLSINGYLQMIDCIKSETTSLENIIKISELILKIKENIESFNDQDFSSIICDIFTRVANSDIRVFPVTTIESLLSKLPQSEKWLSLYITFLKTDLFDKKLFALKKIDQMLNDTAYSEMMVAFLKQNIETILSVPPHQEFYQLLGHVCAVSLAHNIISFEKIREFWNNQEFVHQSELKSFFSMFNVISNQLPSIFASDFANLFLHPKNKSLEWIKALSTTCTNFMTLKYETEFIELRDELFRIGFVDIIDPISLEARRGIVNVSAIQINQLLPQIIDEEKVKASIEDVLYLISLTLNSNETIENTQPVIDFCFRHIDSNLSSSIVTKLCINHHAKISDIQLSQLMMDPSCVSSLYKANIINDDMMDNYFISLTKFDSGIASILLNYIHSHYNFPLTVLPIPKQELLWNLAIKYESYELCNGIGEIYSSNDGIMLTDSVMITAFLDIFEYYYRQSDNNQKQRSYLYKLLEEFIQKFEMNADFEEFHLQRHKPYQSDSIVYINVPQLNRQVTSTYGNSVSVAVNKIFQLIGKNQYNTIVTFNGQYVTYSHPINLLGNVINAYYQNYTPSNDIPRIQMVRSNIPSIRICDSDLMNSLVNDLKNYGCWQLRVLINKLPTSTNLLHKIRNLQKMNSYDFESLIMIDYPYYSIYVLESLFGASLSFDDLKRTGCISYIISIIPRFKIKAQLFLVLSFLSHLLDDQLNIFSDQLFDSLLRVVLSQDYSISANYLTIINKLKPKIPPYEEFKLIQSPNPNPNKLPEPQIAEYNDNNNSKDGLNEINTKDSTSQILSNVIVKYIFGYDGNMRVAFSSNFSNLSIPISYFTAHLDKINEINCNSLLTVMSLSLKEPNKEIADFALNNFKVESPIFPFVVKVFLEQLNNGQYSETEKLNEIFEYIAENFLKANGPNYSPIILNNAFEILSKAPSEILLKKLGAISNVELFEYDINGDECSVQMTTTGLKNLGMSCFLNATLQQFFGIPCVRKSLISYHCNDTNQQESLFLIEMKKLFGRMRDTVESFVSPANVVDKWITWEGTKLNPRIQQDASEFVQMLIDKLELGKVIPQKTFSGNLVQVIESIDDPNLFRTTRNESFSILSISLSPTLDECFDKIHTPDFLNDYFAEPLGKKIDAKKTEFLGNNLPDHLIIQLKRFKFEYTTYEREKINDPVSFTERIDINKHCFVSEKENTSNNNNGIYLLGGVIIHIGSAEGGHYISYVKQRDTGNWFEYNDNVVTPISLDYVMRNSNYNNQTAYILFYDKEDLNEVDDSELDPDLKKEVTDRNELCKFYSVFCSTSFEFFINELGKRKEMAKEVILYAINVCPHLVFNQGSVRDIIFQIKDFLKNDENLCHFLFDNLKSFKPILFDNPSYVHRNLICHNILHPSLKKIKIDENAFQKLMELFDQASVRINDSEHYFMILYWSIKSNQEAAEKFEVRKKVEEIVVSIVQNNTKNKEEQLQSQQQLIQQQKNIYDQLNFNWIVKIIIKLGPSKEFIEQIETNPEFFKLFILSNSDSRIYMKLFDELPQFNEHKEKCEELVVNFLKKNSLHFAMPLVCGCLFIYIKEKAFSFFSSLKFKMNNAISNIADVAFCYVMLCYNMICDQLLLDHFEDWFIPISLSDNYDARLLINHAILMLIRHTKIKDEIGYMNSRDKINYPESYFEIITVDNVNSQEMMNRIRIILDCLIKNLDKVEEIINKQIPEPFSPSTPEKVESSSWKIEQYQCCSYLQIMSVLVELSQQEIIPDEGTEEKNSIQITNQPVDYHRIIEFSHFLIKHSHPYDVDIRYTAKSLKDKIDDEFIDGICVTLFEESNNETNENKPNTLMMVSSRIRNVIEILLPVIEKKNSLKESTIEKYARTLCFSNMIQMFQYQEFVPRFITILTKLNKSTIMKIIDNDLDQLCKNNIISVLFALKTMNEKRDISNYLESCLSYKYFSYDDFIQLFVECNSGILPNLKQLFWLLNTSYYSLPTRKAIWKYLTDCNTDYLIFKNHFMNKDYGKSNGDYIEISMYLISRFDKENQQEKTEIINHLIEMSICYMDVFALSYDILKKNALEQIKDKEFIKSLFCQKIGHNDVVFIDYCRNVAFPSLTKEEINVYFNIMFDFVLQNLKSYNIILNDPAKGAFDDTIDNDNNDLTDVIISLSFMVNMKFCPLNQIKQIAKEIVEKLSNADIWERIKNNKIEKLKKALIDIQTF